MPIKTTRRNRIMSLSRRVQALGRRVRGGVTVEDAQTIDATVTRLEQLMTELERTYKPVPKMRDRAPS